MPGLLVAVSLNGTPLHLPTLAEATRLLCHNGRFQAREHLRANFAVTQVVGSSLGHHSYESHDLVVWVYGAVYPRSASLTGGYDETHSADYVAEQYRKYESRVIDHLNGEFTLVVLDTSENQLLIANDRFAIRPWYVLALDECWVLSPEVKALLPFLPCAPQLDEITAAGILAFNKIRLGDRTLMKGVEVLPAASLWSVHLGSNRVTKNRYWQLRYNDSMTSEALKPQEIDNLVDCFRFAMTYRSQVRPDRRVGISLSGGLDSRSMVAALPADRLGAITGHTYGLIESDEVRLAQQVAQVAGLSQYIYELRPIDFITHARSIMRLSDELDIFVQGGQLSWLPHAKNHIDVIMTGLALDVTLGGIRLTPDVLMAQNDHDVLNLLKKRNSVFQESEWSQMFGRQVWHEAGEAAYKLAQDLISSLPQETPAAKYDLFINSFSVRRIIMPRYALHRMYFETASPTYDYNLIDLILSIPTAQRANHTTFIPFLIRLSQALANIPYQRTMLPVTAPRSFWDVSAAIERQREQLYTDIWRETKGRVFIPYRRYYTNYDEWLRVDPDWIQLTDELLRNPDAAIYQIDLIQPQYVVELIDQHRAALKSNRQRLILLMSLELYLQEYFA